MTAQDLAKLLSDKKLTIKQLSELTGISERMIYRYKNGSHEIPRKVELALRSPCNH